MTAVLTLLQCYEEVVCLAVGLPASYFDAFHTFDAWLYARQQTVQILLTTVPKLYSI